MTQAALLLLAGGAARRMSGRDKLLEEIDGVPLLRRLAEAGIAADLPVYVALRPDRPARAAALGQLKVKQISVPDADEGMAASIRAGVACLPEDVTGVILLPADMPEIDAAALWRISTAHAANPDRILRGATEDGRPGHPVLFPKARYKALLTLTGDQGARRLLNSDVTLVRLPGAAAVTDLDTPEDWAQWRAARDEAKG